MPWCVQEIERRPSVSEERTPAMNVVAARDALRIAMQVLPAHIQHTLSVHGSTAY